MKLYRFDYSCYARKVQMVLDLCGVHHELVDVPYGNRQDLAELTGGYIQVPVLVDDGEVLTDSRKITERLAAKFPERLVVDDATRGSIWAYADWCDTELEDALFRVAVPGLVARLASAWERALFVLIKDRKYGEGCTEAWAADHDALLANAQRVLEPTAATLDARPFLFGNEPTLADAALYGQLFMQGVADELMPGRISPTFVAWMGRMDRAALDSRAAAQ